MLGVGFEGGEGDLALVAFPLSTREDYPVLKRTRRVEFISVLANRHTLIISFLNTQPFYLM